MASLQWTVEMESCLIDLVYLRPCLWNIRDSEFQKRKLKFREFQDIGFELGQRFPDFKSLFHHDSLLKRFNNLKSYFRKLKRKDLSKNVSEGFEIVPKWVHFKRLKFLEDVINAAESSSNLEFREITVNDSLADFESEFSVEGHNDLYDDQDQSNDYGLPNSVEPDVDCYDTAVPRKRIKLELIESERDKNSNTSETRHSQEKAPLAPPRFQYTHFANHVAKKLESYEPHVACQVEFKISQILYEASMGIYSQRQNRTAKQACATPSVASSAVSSSHKTGKSVSAPQSLENQFEVIHMDKVISQDD